ncbi:MAG: hemolysin family protein, partial [Phascolarctobacterium sp.]
MFLVALNGFFVASEFSIVKVRPSRLDALLKEGNRRAVYAKKVTEHLDAFLSVTQLGITIASLGLGWIGEPTVAKMLHPLFEILQLPANVEHTIAFVVGFSVITALHIVLGELVPKSLSIQKTEQIVLFVAWPLLMFDKLMYPAVWFLNHVANWILRRMGVEAASEAEEAHNEDEIRILMEESHKHGYIDKTELTYLDNVFDFSDRRASDIMVPRTDMICLYLEDPVEENIQTALDERMTRY